MSTENSKNFQKIFPFGVNRMSVDYTEQLCTYITKVILYQEDRIVYGLCKIISLYGCRYAIKFIFRHK